MYVLERSSIPQAGAWSCRIRFRASFPQLPGRRAALRARARPDAGAWRALEPSLKDAVIEGARDLPAIPRLTGKRGGPGHHARIAP